ncbi:helix-turn-helix domain-containing protein [uncultured Xylophilus sp.]|uniref:helix-turn-helix domain-containing protein n=1 Tax=uncultured Xylophilus sp. TaxID=296832 RepID=UPI0025D93714|nr:helix-turn-helix domain-containing protein [uncultured Xylophilus sp.]
MNVRVSSGGDLPTAISTAISSELLEFTVQGDGSWVIADLGLGSPEPPSDLLADRQSGRTDVPQIGLLTRKLSLRIPKAAFPATPLHGTRLRGPAARLLADHALALQGYRQHVSTSDCAQVQRETCELVAECVRSLQHRASAGGWRPTRRFWWHRVWWHIEQNLSDPALSPASLCADLGLSRSALYRHFSPKGGLVHYIRDRRLDAVHAQITTTRDVLTSDTLAKRYGMRSSVQLTRLFARKFGYVPDQTLSAASSKPRTIGATV